MQPLSRVRPDADIHMYDVAFAMNSRPTLATKIAECIAESAEVEFALACALAALIGGDGKVGLTMYTDATSRQVQMAMIKSAAKATIAQDHFEVLSIILKKAVGPAMKARDKLAHWCWGYSPDLPDDLLLLEPTNKTIRSGTFMFTGKQSGLDRNEVYVVTEADLNRTLQRIRRARVLVAYFVNTAMSHGTTRDMLLQQLKDQPEIQRALKETQQET